jgi:hypothetical protein
MASATQMSAPVPRTSVDTFTPPVGEVTVRFRRWYAHASTAYQAGQQAGFPAAQAHELVRRNVATIVHVQGQADHESDATRNMVRK